MDLYERIKRDIKNCEAYMLPITETVEKLENNYKAIQTLNRRMDDINEGAWAYAFLSDEQRARDFKKAIQVQRRVLRMRKMLLNRLAAVSQAKIEGANNRTDKTFALEEEVNRVFFGDKAIMTKTA